MRRLRLLAIALGAGTTGLLGFHCAGTTLEPELPTAENDRAQTFALAVDVGFAQLDLPPSSRPHGPPPERIPLSGWVNTKGEQYRTNLPIRTRNLFFHRPPPGMELVDAQGELVPHKARAGSSKPRWTFTESTLTLIGVDNPADADYFLIWPQATARESALNLETSGAESPEEFVRQSVQAGPEYRGGLLLPAPAVASWDLKVPPAADLWFSPALIQPEISDGDPSDGATLTVAVTVGGESKELYSVHLASPQFVEQRIDLSEHSGQDVRLSFTTQPGRNALFDYVFVSEPVVASRKAHPTQVVLIFVDTLRPDHLGAYGYERDTSPALDAWSEGSVVFESARSVAPWTLPSARSVVTGRHPEHYDIADTLQGRLRSRGFASAMFAGNLYLGANFDMNRDWGLHRVTLWPTATEQVDHGLEWLAQQRGRDAVLMLHFMDAHLPYREPEEYRRKFADDPPPTLTRDEFHRNQVLSARLKPGAERQYVRDRYDNNIRYIDDELARLFDQVEDDAIVVYFSDHGEEFWEHRGYEHGHTLFDELLRVPLVIRSPNMPPGRVSEPVSLLDVTPTVLDALGLPLGEVDGVSLIPASQGKEPALEALQSRKLAFGRPLYGYERWGVLADQVKYTTSEGREAAYNLEQDPREKVNVFLKSDSADPGAEHRPHLGEALGRQVGVGYRLTTGRMKHAPTEDTVVHLKVPGGIQDAWVGDEPTESSRACVGVEGEVVTAIWSRGYRGTREVWVIPNNPLQDTTHLLTAKLEFGDSTAELTVPAGKAGGLPKQRVPLTRQKVGDRTVFLTYGIAPIPDAQMTGLSGYDPETSAELEALGYVTGVDDDDAVEGSACR